MEAEAQTNTGIADTVLDTNFGSNDVADIDIEMADVNPDSSLVLHDIPLVMQLCEKRVEKIFELELQCITTKKRTLENVKPFLDYPLGDELMMKMLRDDLASIVKRCALPDTTIVVMVCTSIR